VCSLWRVWTVAALMSASWGHAPSDPMVLRQALSHVSPNEPAGAVSGDGRFVAFVSLAPLLPADSNSVTDIYVLDREARVLTLETSTPDGASANGSSWHPQLSADGRYLAFDSIATNLTDEPNRNEANDVFVRDRQTGITRRVSVGAAGQESNGPSGPPSISADGAFVAFASSATNLVPEADVNGIAADIYRLCLATGVVDRVSLDSDGRQYGVSHSPSLDATGRLVVFVGGDRALESSRAEATGSARRSVYLRDLASRTTTCVSCSTDGGSVERQAFAPEISADGRVVVFAVQTEPERSDIAVYDRSSSRSTVITERANARSAAPRVSADGALIVFVSWASDLLCVGRCSHETVDENLLPDVYRFDGRTGRFSRLSGSAGTWWVPSVAPAVDARGRTVTFSSSQPHGPQDESVDFDLYVCSPACE
jgi:Tol biopolymer transport system component